MHKTNFFLLQLKLWTSENKFSKFRFRVAAQRNHCAKILSKITEVVQLRVRVFVDSRLGERCWLVYVTIDVVFTFVSFHRCTLNVSVSHPTKVKTEKGWIEKRNKKNIFIFCLMWKCRILWFWFICALCVFKKKRNTKRSN